MENKISIGSSRWTGYEPLFLAEKEGIFSKNKCNIEIIRLENEHEIVNKFKSGEIDGAALTLDMLILLYQTNFPCKAVLVMDYSMGGDMIIGTKDMTSIQDIKNKKIGLEKLYVNEYFLARSLAENNIKIDEVEIEYIPTDSHLIYLEAGKVDAIATYNPHATTLLQKGYNLLFSSKDIPSSIIDLLIFPEDFYNKNKDEILKIMQSWFDTLKYINKHYQVAMKTMAESEGIDEYEFKIAFDDIIVPDLEENIDFFSLESKKNIFKISDITIDFMLKKGMLKERIDTSKIFSPELLKKVK